jgi:glycosyltransferase involved in cell wall biosynthesis
MRIGIMGSRGIPNRYGGFERLAEQLSLGLADRGHEVYVYNSHNHAWQEKTWGSVNIIHCYDPEYLVGCSGQFIYDLNCILDARSRKFDVLLILGYTSSSVWGRLLPRSSAIIYHMDGLEWQRKKYRALTRHFLRYAEKLAIRFSQFQVSDSPVIQTYFREAHQVDTECIAYGAQLPGSAEHAVLKDHGLHPGDYFLLIARMEPENNLETILEGFSSSNTGKKLLVVGNPGNKFGRRLVKTFGHDRRIRFTGAIYDGRITHNLRLHSSLYFHGHSSGGTNPSLLEAMAGQCLIAAHDNPFNRTVLQEDALYFSSPADIRRIIGQADSLRQRSRFAERNLEKIRQSYNWEKIVGQYEGFMLRCVHAYARERNIPGKIIEAAG